MSSGGAALQPTFNGHVATTNDALILFEACLQGHLSHVPRRPHDRERSSLIRSGSVFIYEENASGIKRWTDGVTWSPSRILGNFLVYRELDKPFPPGEKKRAMKKNQRRPSRPGEPYPRPDGTTEAYSPNSSQTSPFSTPATASSEMERQLIGSLVDSYGFKPDGLVKKTMSVTVQGVTHHLVSYYNVTEVLQQKLRTPSQTENLQYVRPRQELTQKQSFRAPLEESEEVEGVHAPESAYGYRVAPGYMQDYRQPYYMGPGYPPMPPQQSMGAPYQPVPPMHSSYLGAPAGPSGPQMHPPRAEYGAYEPPGYSRPYNPINSNVMDTSRSGPGTPAVSVPPISNQSQHMMYPPSLQRPSSLTPGSGDSHNSMPYRSGVYNMQPSANSLDTQRQMQSSPAPKQEDRSEPGPHASAMYQSPRPPYYSDNSAHQVQHPPYPQHPHAPHWSGPPPGQQ